MNDLDLLLKQHMEAQKASERDRQLMLEDQLIRQLEASSKDPRVDLSIMSAIAGGDDALIGAMRQSGASTMRDRSQSRADLAKLERDLVANTGTGVAKLPSGLAQEKKQEAIGERFEESQMRGLFKDIKKDFSKERGALDEIDRQFDGMESAILSGDYERIKGQLSNFARAVNAEKGVLTDTDIGRTYIDTVDNLFTKFASRFAKGGKVNPADVQALAAGIRDARAKLSSTTSERLADLEDTYASDPLGAAVLSRMGGAGIVKKTRDVAEKIGTSKKLQQFEEKLKKGDGSAPKKGGNPKGMSPLEKAKARLKKGQG